MTTQITNSTSAQGQSRDAFLQAVADLKSAHAKFAAHDLSSVAYANARQAALAVALLNLAAIHGVTLETPLHIDSLGEFSIVSRPPGSVRGMGCGPFGDFATVLNKHRPRMGIAPGTVDPLNGWCRMNHFDVERMVLEQHSLTQ